MSSQPRDIEADILAAFDDVVIRFDHECRLTFVNHKFCDLFGGNTADWLGQHSPLNHSITDAAGQCDVSYERGEHMLWLSWHIKDIRGEDGNPTYQAVGRDITERKQHEASLLESKSRAEEDRDAKSLFLATMSHEIRTPMNGVLGMARLLAESDLSPEQRTYVNVIKESGESLLAVINDVLDYSRIEAGKIHLEEDAFDLSALVQGIAELLSTRAFEHDLDIGVFIDPACPIHLIADEGRLRQVLINLMNNGLKFTKRGGVSLSVTCTHLDEDDTAQFRFEVRDTGIGISAEAQARIFEEFAQADDSHARQYEGTGLGLAICKKIIKAMDGTIGVHSVPSIGSTFWFTLPMKTEETGSSSLEVAGLVGLKALVVSPSPITRNILTAQLQQPSMSVVIATSFDDAIMQLEAEEGAPFTTLIADVHIGESDTFDLLRAFSQHTEGRQARSLIVLQPGDRHLLEDKRVQAFDGYLIKPVRQSSLLRRITCVHELAENEAAIQNDRNQAVQDASVLKEDASGTPLRVLLAEDNDLNALLTTSLLDKLGHSTHRAKNGNEVFALLDEYDFDVVLMDMRMPEMDGLEATKAIRTLTNTALAQIPIIALTANAMEEDRRRCLNAGMNDYLAKPVELSALSRVLNHWTNLAPTAKVS